MSEPMNHGHSNPGTTFEREDLSTRGVWIFMVGLAITGFVIYFIIVGMYTFLDRYEHAQMTTASPLSPSTEVSSRRIDFAPGKGDYVDRKFKENGAPMLEHDERGQFADFLLNQENQLNSYGWVDEKGGVAHIPIEHAMELIAARGLPVLPAGAAETKAAAKPAAGAKTAKKK
jgi:hypothetical protein